MRKVVRIMAIQDLGGRREGQKFKSLLVWQILLRHTDENHPLSAESDPLHSKRQDMKLHQLTLIYTT